MLFSPKAKINRKLAGLLTHLVFCSLPVITVAKSVTKNGKNYQIQNSYQNPIYDTDFVKKFTAAGTVIDFHNIPFSFKIPNGILKTKTEGKSKILLLKKGIFL